MLLHQILWSLRCFLRVQVMYNVRKRRVKTKLNIIWQGLILYVIWSLYVIFLWDSWPQKFINASWIWVNEQDRGDEISLLTWSSLPSKCHIAQVRYNKSNTPKWQFVLSLILFFYEFLWEEGECTVHHLESCYFISTKGTLHCQTYITFPIQIIDGWYT